jgi:hypothetical protein
MSIISDALKKAEKEKVKEISSKEYLNKILGPQRKTTYKKQEFRAGRPSESLPKSWPSEPKDTESTASGISGRTWVVSSILIVLTIAILTSANIFLIPSEDVGVAPESIAQIAPQIAKVPLEAEAYTDVKAELPEIPDRVLIQVEFLDKFELSGIVYDAEDSWAIVNNEVVRQGDVLRNAEVLSITPKKVTLLFKDESFDLAVK